MAEPAPKKQNTASRQLRELQRLMAWSWDSRWAQGARRGPPPAAASC